MRVLLSILSSIVICNKLSGQDQTSKTHEIKLISYKEKYKADGQTPPERCDTDLGLIDRLKDPDYKDYFIEMHDKIDKSAALLSCHASNSVIIPLAVHFDGSFNCSNIDCLIDATQAQIDVLNNDFAALNSDLAAYQNLLTSCGIRPDVSTDGTCISFCLATQNHPAASGIPDGEPAITVGQYSGSLNGNFIGGGNSGAPEWIGYLNLHVVNVSMAGVADGIPGVLNGDGVTVAADVFGGPGFAPCTSGNTVNTSPVWNLGRTMTHEVGHYLGLFHVFQSGCGAGDLISDTPAQANPNSGCTADCTILGSNTCITGEISQYNFMDYFDDACLVMFTEEQATVMNNFALVAPWATGTGCSDGGEIITQACAAATCDDGIQNGQETGIDCGGPDCRECVVAPVCSVGLEEIINTSFDDCTLPSGWSVVSINGESTSGISFNMTSVPGGGAPVPSDFMGCIALIDDDVLTSADPGDTRCILTNVIDMSQYLNSSLIFDWQNESLGSDGDFIVEVYDGSSWVQVFFAEGDLSANDQIINLSAYANSDFQIRFCYDDEGGWQWGVGIDNVTVCGTLNNICPASFTTVDISGSYCDGADATVSATSNGNVAYTWSSSNPNISIVDSSSANTSVEMSAMTPCHIETGDISLVAICTLDDSELFNGVVSSINVYPKAPEDIATLVVLNENTCNEPILVDPNCEAFITVTPDIANPTFPVVVGQSGTVIYTIMYSSPFGAPECCITPGGATEDMIIDGGFESGGPGTGWTEFSTAPFNVIDPSFPLNGSFSAWLGAIAEGQTYVQQTITIPASSVSADLSFNIAAGQCDCAGGDDMTASIDGMIVWSLCNPVTGQVESEATICGGLTSPTGLFLNSGPIDVSAFADGNSYTLEFSTIEVEADGTNTSIYVDDVALMVMELAPADPCMAQISGNYNCISVEIPTISEWGIMILGLLILICSIMAIKQRHTSTTMS